MTPRRWRWPHPKVTRDLALFSTALGLLTFEVLWGGGRPAVLTVCSALLGLPGVLRMDEARRKRDGDDG